MSTGSSDTQLLQNSSSFSERRQQRQRRRPSDSSSITFVNRPSVEAQPAEFGAKAPVSSQIENAGLVAVLTQQLQLLGKIVEQKDAEIERYKRLVENLEAENAALRNNVKKAKSNTVRMEQNVKKAPVEESDDEDTFYQA